ncbi:LOW QUALITY PROTEIN: olfactory receptor 51H1-like [Pantherophis guttatus]|uniref:LOW QUALITY PROTEIN: olfactory receptor 51H1-like n=1 Tax=Pantherophis guttatus TaxID=94885 RepID=A0A6P9BM27_PANGU|nr:LOW QUALITY PROTEIN: olfactory receptor 51H1-like [Pantherophis guttatus]
MFDNSSLNLRTFVLTGIPGMEEKNALMAFLLFVLCVFILLGNSLILFVIKIDQSLHEPMYIFLSILACSDLGLSMSTLPTMLQVYWSNSKEITFSACLAQMFFIHAFQWLESGTLVAMAFDRVVAIREPLRYRTLFPNTIVAKIGITAAVRCICVCFPAPLLIKRLRFCRSNILSYSFCFHPDVMKLSCVDIKVNILYGLIVMIFTLGFDVAFILVSYIMILKTVLGIASHQERLKTFSTCISHMCAILIFYVPIISICLLQRYGKHLSPLVHMLMANVYIVVPPLLNPIVYGMKTQQIRHRICNFFPRKQIRIRF